MKKILLYIQNFINCHKTSAHTFLIVWNSFMTSWATGIAIPLDGLGIPFSLNAREQVSWVQAHLHIPTWTIAALTVVANFTIAYSNWRKAHPDAGTKCPKD